MTTTFLRTLALWAVPALLMAQPALPQLSVEEFKLKNGLRVVLHPDATLPLVAVAVTYTVGGTEAAAMAHLSAHGLPDLPTGGLPAYLVGLGAEQRTQVSLATTTFVTELPAAHLAQALWLEAARMGRLSVGAEPSNKRKPSAPEAAGPANLGTWLPRLMAPWPEYATLLAPSEADLDELAATAFFQQHYLPSNAVLCIAGDFNATQAKQWVEQHFGPVATRRPAKPKPKTLPAPPLGTKDTLTDAGFATPMLMQGYRLPPPNTPDHAVVQAIAKLMALGLGSRLHHRLVVGDQSAEAVMDLSMDAVPEMAILQIALRPGAAGIDVETGIRAEIANFQSALVDSTELARLHSYLMRHAQNALGTLGNLAYTLCQGKALHNDALWTPKSIAQQMAATPEDIRRVAQKYFLPEHRAALWCLPIK